MCVCFDYNCNVIGGVFDEKKYNSLAMKPLDLLHILNYFASLWKVLYFKSEHILYNWLYTTFAMLVLCWIVSVHLPTFTFVSCAANNVQLCSTANWILNNLNQGMWAFYRVTHSNCDILICMVYAKACSSEWAPNKHVLRWDWTIFLKYNLNIY